MDSQNKQRIADIANYEQDLSELLTLLQSSQRPNNQKLLNSEITRINNVISKLKIEENLKNQVPIQIQSSETSNQSQEDSVVYQKIDQYSFDQEDKKFTIYIFLDDIKEKVPSENITIDFKELSFDLKIKNYKGQNLRLAIPKLCHKIKAAESKLLVKKNNIQIVLSKVDKEHWDQIIFKESAFKDKNMPKKDADPQAGLMDMMKKMYEEGDDEMKRTIAKAWTESQDKKTLKK